MTTTMECTALSPDTAPTHLTLATLHRELNAFAMGVTSDRGGGNHGHLALVMSDADYQQLTGAAFIIPNHPGPNPAPGATQPQINENNRLHTNAIAEHKTYKDTETTLKQMLLKAVPNTYIKELQDQLLGYAQLTTRDLLAHLDANYGTVTFEDLARNLENMHTPWSRDKPIKNLWTQITQAKTYAAAHDPITEKAMIMSALTNLQVSGLFSDDLKSWRNKSIADQTWINLKKHFNQANKHRLSNPTITNAGYTAKEQTNETKENKSSRNTTNDEFKNWKYCWMHGMNKSHRSTNCRKPATGHIRDATINNMKNGCTTITQPYQPREDGNNRKPPLATQNGNTEQVNTPTVA
jgi:hypothetical protein